MAFKVDFRADSTQAFGHSALTDNKASKHLPEQHTETDKAKTSDKVLPGAAITKAEDNIVQKRAQAREAVKSYKLTDESQQSFSIRDEHGREIKDSRAPKRDTTKAYEKPAEKADQQYAHHQQDVEAATKRCLDEGAMKWGKQNVQDIKLNKDDLNAALALSLLGPDAYKTIGHDRAAAIGKSVIEHCAPTVHEVVKAFNPAVPKNLESLKSNADDDKKLESAGHVFLDSCKNSFGAEKVNALHIDAKDWSASVGLYMVGPDAYKAMGHEAVQSLGKQTFLFGFAPAMGAAEEAKKMMHDLPALGVEGSVNALLGAGAGFITKLIPSTAIPLAIGGGAMAVKDQFDPKTQAHNSELWGINRSADQMSNSQIIAAANQTEHIMGPALFHGLFGTVTGGAGFVHGEGAGLATKEALSNGGIKQAVADVGNLLRKDGVHAAVNDVTHQGAGEVARVQEARIKTVEKHQSLEHAHILGTPEKHVSVEKDYIGYKYKIDGDVHVLQDRGDWAYGGVEGKKSPLISTFKSPGIKLHVETLSVQDLASVQKVLIPALEKDPELVSLVPNWKTDPRGFPSKDGTQINAMLGKGQDAKGFTLYVRDPDKAMYVLEKIDGLMDKNGLDLSRRIDSGNIDEVYGKTNRIGICREKWEATTMAGGINDDSQKVGARLGTLLEEKMKAQLGVEKFSQDQLRIIEHESGIKIGTLAYDQQNKLMLRATSPNSSGSGQNFYLTEGGSNTDFGHLTDRPAMYALAKHFNVDQVDSFLADQKPVIRMSLKPGDETSLRHSFPTLSAPGEAERIGLTSSFNVRAGIDKDGGYVIDSHNPIYTWKRPERLSRGGSIKEPELIRYEPGTVVRVEPYQVINLGSEKGPTLDIFNDKNEIFAPRVTARRLSQDQTHINGADAASKETFNRVIFEGKQVSINKPELVIGRTKGDLLLGESDLTSSQHAALRIDAEGRVHIRDLNSKNGTYVNGVKLADKFGGTNNELVLRPGDRVGIPHPHLEFIFTGAIDAPLQRCSPKDILEYKLRPGESNSVTDTMAVRQSQQLQHSFELSTPLTKGFQDIPNGSAINGEGQVVQGRPTTVFDPDRDQRLRTLFKSAHAQLDGLRANGQEKELRTALADMAHDSLTPKGKWSAEEIDIAYKRFSNENQGKQILLGEYIRQADQNIGGGVCAQQTLMYKALCNEFGLDTKIVRGHVDQVINPITPSAADFKVTHTWAVDTINGREVVFDPRARTHGAERADMHHYFDGKNFVKPESVLEHQSKKAPYAKNDEVIFNNSEWKFERVDPHSGDYVLSQALEKQLSVQEFKRLNGEGVPSRFSDKYPTIRASYRVERSSGQVENDWQFEGQKNSSRPGQPGYYLLRRVQTIAVPPHTVRAIKD